MHRVKRAFLVVLLSLTGLGTVGAVGFVFFGGTGRSTEAALMTAAALGYLLLISFAAYTAFDHAWWRIPAVAGVGGSAVMMAVMPVYAWWECYAVYGRGFNQTAYELERFVNRLMLTGLTTAGLLCLVAFVMTPRIGNLGRLLQAVTALAMATLYIIIIAINWGDLGRNETTQQGLLASLIVSGAGLIAVAVLNKFFGIKMPDPLTSVRPLIRVECPRCLLKQEVRAGESQCARCRLRFKIEVEEPKCPRCGYNLYLLTRPKCPECGLFLRKEDVSENSDQLMAWAKANDAAAGRAWSSDGAAEAGGPPVP